MSEPVPAWKFWHPMPFWHCVAIFVVASIIANVLVAVLRMFVTTAIPIAAGGGVGAFLGIMAVVNLRGRYQQ